MNKEFKKSYKQYINLIISGLVGGYIAIYLHTLLFFNPQWNNIDAMSILLVGVLLLGFITYHTNRIKK